MPLTLHPSSTFTPITNLPDPSGVRLPDVRPSPASDRPLLEAMRVQLNRELRGKERVVDLTLACVLARGHLLIEDLPGLGKTTLAKALATVVGGRFNRVQCTPDLMPGDVTGFSIFNQKTRDFEFLPGPVFADVLLVDEINRATPRTQSALLEAMAEHQVTVDNQRRPLAETFFVIATQNPVDHHGTYPLPEAQLDRFAMKLSVGYPDRAHELDMLAGAVGHCCERDSQLPGALIGVGQLHALQQRVAAVTVAPSLRAYLVDLANATRGHPRISIGVSPRGLLTWQRVSQAHAYLNGRAFVTPDDIQHVAGPVLDVRLGCERADARAVIEGVIRSVAVPVEVKR